MSTDSVVSSVPDSLVKYKTLKVDGAQIFYREAGASTSPAILLLHGYPTSSHMFREIIPALARNYHVIAPDIPGFGFTEIPTELNYKYTFDQLAITIGAFVEAINLSRYAIYIFDYGAPVGLRLAMAHPERISALISQNGNAYEEGLSDGWGPLQKYWQNPTPENRDAVRFLLTPETTKWQYTHGVTNESLIPPESYTLDSALLSRSGMDEVQLDLILDYASNVALYPQFHQYFAKHKPPLLAVWGKNDPFFLPAGAEAYRRDIPSAEVHLYDTGHFALETHAKEITDTIERFLVKFISK